MALRTVGVFLASSMGTRPDYAAAARAAGAAIAGRGLGLVYGGAAVGTMGVLADAALAAGGRVVGVIPGALVDREVAHRGLSELIVVPDMHARKAVMAAHADGFLVLPGGYGTLEEVFEILTAVYIGLHGKPVAFVDVAGFYGPMQAFLDHAVVEGLVRPEVRALARFHGEVDAALDDLATRA